MTASSSWRLQRWIAFRGQLLTIRPTSSRLDGLPAVIPQLLMLTSKYRSVSRRCCPSSNQASRRTCHRHEVGKRHWRRTFAPSGNQPFRARSYNHAEVATIWSALIIRYSALSPRLTSISPNRKPPSRLRPSTGCLVRICTGPRARE